MHCLIPNPTLACFASPVHPICLPRPRSRYCGMITAVTIFALSSSGGFLASALASTREVFTCSLSSPVLCSGFLFASLELSTRRIISPGLSNRATARNSLLCGPTPVVSLIVSASPPRNLGQRRSCFSHSSRDPSYIQLYTQLHKWQDQQKEAAAADSVNGTEKKESSNGQD